MKQLQTKPSNFRKTIGYIAGVCAILSLPGGMFLFALAFGWLAVVIVVFGTAMLLQFPLLYLAKLWIDQEKEWESTARDFPE